MKNKHSLKILVTLTALLALGCAKEKPFDVQYKEVELLSKSNFITEETVQLEDGKTITRPVEYLYVPMTLGTPMNVTDADPFYQGQEKLVRLSWSEEGLEIREIEKDSRFAGNDLNEYPVLTIPGDYKSYRCREDAYGECTNVEEENTELEWYQKSSFLPKFENIKKREINELDIFTLNNGSCLTEGDTKVVDYEVTPGVINIEVEKNYRMNSGNFFCFLMSFYNDQLNTNGFRVRNFYSLVRLDKLATPGYEPLNYPEPDHDEFGFFTKEERTLTDEFDRQRRKKTIFMERWKGGTADNPTTEGSEYSPRFVKYHLTPEYSKPENAYILEATKEAIGTMNSEMRASNVPVQLELIEQPDPAKAVSPGDLRYTSLVLIEDPLANGLLGYGPAVSNPYTGEIVKAHTNMYLGVLKSMTRWVYQAAVDITEERYAEANGGSQATLSTISVSPEALSNIPQPLALGHFPELVEANLPKPQVPTPVVVPNNNDDDQGEDEQGNNDNAVVGSIERALHNNHMHLGGLDKKEALRSMSFKKLEQRIRRRVKSKTNLKAAFILQKLKEEGTLTKDQESLLKEQARLDRYAENNALAVEFFPIGGTSKVIYPELLTISGVQTERGTLKPFEELTTEQKRAVQKAIVRSSYKATLVHELGHNLGLRHNFMGSWDKDNFYTEEEARALGMEGAPAYSSIMDYSFSEFNQLKAFGKYDLAALRFGYAREVELKDGQFVKVEGSLSKFKETLGSNDLKEYQFCTDENAGLSSICNRFDEGTTLVEVSKYLIKRYKDYYKYRNFRDGREDFSAYDLPAYIFGRRNEFLRIRDIMEEYEFFAEIFGPGLMAQGCSPDEVKQFPVCKMINDRRDSVAVVGDFFMEIMAMPDHLCALAKPEEPNVIVEYRKLGEIYDDIKFDLNYVPTSCFDPAVKTKVAEAAQDQEPRITIGETGKFFNGFKDMDPDYKYVTDRFVLGTWPDKLMAFNALFTRTWGKGNTDRNHMSLMDIPSIRVRAQGFLDHYILGKPLPETSVFTMEDGNKFKVPYAFGTDYKINPLERYFGWLKEFLGLPLGEGAKGDFLEAALHQLKTNVEYGVDYEDVAFETRNLTAVTQINGFVPDQDKNPNEVYYYDAKNRMTFAADEYTPYAQRMIKSINEFEILEAAGRLSALKIVEARKNPMPPQTLPVPVQYFWVAEAELQQTLITAATNGREFTVAQFIQFFGQPVGPALHAVYMQGADLMKQIVAMKEVAMKTPAADLTAEELALYNVPVELVEDYAKGLITEEVLDYYASQLRKLPYRHSYRTNDGRFSL
ncbi:MAG: zinc-dependent metalloprotease [Bacteriovoracaceae bacterium]|nr:zinc-dependent metalloprotease [Bacteriovoracaceae bacterium]